MRNLLLALILVGVVACEDEVLPTKPNLTLQKAKPAVNAAVVAMPKVDTTKASSICRASVRAGGRLKLRLDEAPEDVLARKKAVGYAALIADACK